MDRQKACVSQKLAADSQQPHYVLRGCNHTGLMQHLVYISRIRIPLSHPLTNERTYPQRESWVFNLQFKPSKISGPTKKPAYLSHICWTPPHKTQSLEDPRSSKKLELVILYYLNKPFLKRSLNTLNCIVLQSEPKTEVI